MNTKIITISVFTLINILGGVIGGILSGVYIEISSRIIAGVIFGTIASLGPCILDTIRRPNDRNKRAIRFIIFLTLFFLFSGILVFLVFKNITLVLGVIGGTSISMFFCLIFCVYVISKEKRRVSNDAK